MGLGHKAWLYFYCFNHRLYVGLEKLGCRSLGLNLNNSNNNNKTMELPQALSLTGKAGEWCCLFLQSQES